MIKGEIKLEKSRTKNTIKNVKTGLIVQLINKVMGFIVRTVFISVLGKEYLGINGLFTNILTVLSFAELGIGSAIIFSMYKPIAEDDKEKIKSFMQLYKKCYNIIGIFVLICGILIIPFLKIIIKEPPNIKENISIIYLLFLINTSTSYFFTYKKSIISAYQQQSIINKIDSVIYVIKNIIEIIILKWTRQYLVYLFMEIFATIIENIVLASKATKMFPYLKEKEVKPLEKKEKKKIFSNVKALVAYQFGSIIMDGSDNILISSLINVTTVGVCSNYTLILSSVKSVLNSALNGITASIGNLNTNENIEKKEDILHQYLLVSFFIYSFCATAFIALSNPFINIWIGENYILPLSVPIALGISFFLGGIRQPSYTYRVTLGLFRKGSFTAYIAAITNIVFSIILCKFFDVTGIYIGTSLALLVSYIWIDPCLIYKYEFKKTTTTYFKKLIIYIIVFFIDIVVTLNAIKIITIDGFLGFILKMILVMVIPNIINLIALYKEKEFKAINERFFIPIIHKINIFIRGEK